MSRQMTKEEMVVAFNNWMEDYTNRPEAFEKTSSSAIKYLKEKFNGEEPSYGQVCAELMFEYLHMHFNSNEKE